MRIYRKIAGWSFGLESILEMWWRKEIQIYGDGVNIAARLESLAEAGGICISGTTYDHVKNKIALGYESLGEQTVKNIAEPVRVYRVLMEPGVAVSRVAAERKVKPRQWQRLAVSLGIVVIVVVAALCNLG